MQLHYHTLRKSDKWSLLTLTLADKRSVPWGGIGRGPQRTITIWVTDNKRKLKCICSNGVQGRARVRRPVGDIAFSSPPFLLAFNSVVPLICIDDEVLAVISCLPHPAAPVQSGRTPIPPSASLPQCLSFRC